MVKQKVLTKIKIKEIYFQHIIQQMGILVPVKLYILSTQSLPPVSQEDISLPAVLEEFPKRYT